MSSLKNNTYSQHFNTELSSGDLAYKFNIPSTDTIRSWIKRYTERIEIVE
ncbi:hypothetical protein ACP3TN_11270 [Staphylococcus sp. IPLA37011]|nr:hypothetical protein [Staphylococcus equorum]MDK9873122.1 hypothetical protein [Staphylococcus equorum]